MLSGDRRAIVTVAHTSADGLKIEVRGEVRRGKETCGETLSAHQPCINN